MTLSLAWSVETRRQPLIGPRLDPELTALPLLDDMLAGHFTALGETHRVGRSIDWSHNPSADIEWLILLNKFYHAPGLVQAFVETRDRRYLDLWKHQVEGWIATMEPGFIAADVTGRRLQNWIYALALWQQDASDHDPAFLAQVERSLADQADWLRANLHPARNHRTLELFALLLVGVWLGDTEQADWAMARLADNAATDFLPDGVHVELSSHYHCLALRNLIEAETLARDNGVAVPPVLSATIASASRFAWALHKPDGLIPALSDADTGDYRAMLGPMPAPAPVEVFPHGGYVVLRDAAAVSGNPQGHYLVFDCGPLGAGNHGHLDCLSFEFAAHGRSLIVDPGRYTYHEGGAVNERAAFRSTAAHNVVLVDGCEQTAYRQGPKRMKIAGPAPQVRLLRADHRCVQAVMSSHEYGVVHERAILRVAGGWWLIHDRMRSAEPHDYALHLQLAPDGQGRAQRVNLPDGTAAVLAPNLLIVPLAAGHASIALDTGWVAPVYGHKLPAPRLTVSQQGGDAWFATLLVPFSGVMPQPGFSCDGQHFAVRIDGNPAEHGRLPC